MPIYKCRVKKGANEFFEQRIDAGRIPFLHRRATLDDGGRNLCTAPRSQ